MDNFDTIELMHETGAKGLAVHPVGSTAAATSSQAYEELALLPVQTHSSHVAVASNRNQHFPDTDALVTFQPGLRIGVRTADCVPILIYAPDARGVAAVHAGWRGTLDGILENAINTLIRHGAKPEKMKITFGASISMERYEVDEELADRFRKAGFGAHVGYPDGEDTKPHIDLQGINITRALRCGLTPANITPSSYCTFGSIRADGSPIYQSHRRSHGGPGRNLTMIWLEKEP